MSVAVVTTTIHVPVLLKDYCENAKQFGHTDVGFIVIGDKKTPLEAADFCRQLEQTYGYQVEYYDVAAQRNLLRHHQELHDFLPYNSIQRRNIGLVQAYESGADIVITIDDDNFMQGDDDFIGRHSIVGKEAEVTAIESTTGWFNVCELLIEERNLPFYHRGYPLSQRWQDYETKTIQTKGRVVVNAGLWLGAPDIDALTWLDLPIRTVAYQKTYPYGISLAPGTWSPFNSQNTALARELIPAYFLSPHIGRYDDIWASYIVKRIADHLGHFIHFGPPIVRQDRNVHNYFKDFDNERLGMELTPRFVEELRSVSLQGRDYVSCFRELVEWLSSHPETAFATGLAQHREAIDNLFIGLKIWEGVYQPQSIPAI